MKAASDPAVIEVLHAAQEEGERYESQRRQQSDSVGESCFSWLGRGMTLTRNVGKVAVNGHLRELATALRQQF
jgi:hypothetical protein